MDHESALVAEGQLLSALLQSGRELRRIAALYQRAWGGEWCLNPEHRNLLRLLCVDYPAQHPGGDVPSLPWLLHRLRAVIDAALPITEGMEDEERDAVLTRREAAFDTHSALLTRRRDAAVTVDEAPFWARQLVARVAKANLGLVLQKAATACETEGFAAAVHILETALPALRWEREEGDAHFSHLWENLEDDLASLVRRHEFPAAITRIPTGIHLLDRRLIGGMENGTAGLVVAPSGRGKSTLLREIGMAGVKAGYQVLLISAEERERQVRDQWLSYLTGIPYDQIKQGMSADRVDTEVRPHLQALRQQYGGELTLLDVPSNCSVARVKDEMRRHIPGRQYDLYLWDHLGLLDPSVPVKGSSRWNWEVQLAISEEIREFARATFNSRGEENGVVCWAACQADAVTAEKKIEDLQAKDTAFGKSIGNMAQVILHIQRDGQMEQDSKARIKFTKVREAKTGEIITVTTAFDRARFLAKQPDQAEDTWSPAEDGARPTGFC
jgi:hypothetical protein